MKKRKILLTILVGAIFLCAIVGGTVYYYLFAPQFHPSRTVYIYVDRDDTADSIFNKIKRSGHIKNFTGFYWMSKYKNLIRIYIPDAMLFARMTMYTMCIAVSPEAIKSL